MCLHLDGFALTLFSDTHGSTHTILSSSLQVLPQVLLEVQPELSEERREPTGHEAFPGESGTLYPTLYTPDPIPQSTVLEEFL